MLIRPIYATDTQIPVEEVREAAVFFQTPPMEAKIPYYSLEALDKIVRLEIFSLPQ